MSWVRSTWFAGSLAVATIACEEAVAQEIPPGGALTLSLPDPGAGTGMKIDLGLPDPTGQVTVEHLGAGFELLAREVFDFEGAVFGTPSKVLEFVNVQGALIRVNDQLERDTGSPVRPLPDLMAGDVLRTTCAIVEHGLLCWAEGTKVLDCVSLVSNEFWLLGCGLFWHQIYEPPPKDLSLVSALTVFNDTAAPIKVSFFPVVVINEIAYDATGPDDGHTFVEIFGPPGADVSGWTLQAKEGDGSDNNESFTFPQGTLIPADRVLVVADERDDLPGTTHVANADFLVRDMDPENGPDGMHLLDDTGFLIDGIAYGITIQQVGEGTPARDVFAPLSLERCPAGMDKNDNATNLLPNFPTPGKVSDTCNAIEWIDRGFGDTISMSAGEGVGLDFWLSGAPDTTYFVLMTCLDPGAGLPFDPVCTPISLQLANLAPFVAWRGTLDSMGASVGLAQLNFADNPIGGFGMSFDVWIGTLAFDPTGPGFFLTNNVRITLEP